MRCQRMSIQEIILLLSAHFLVLFHFGSAFCMHAEQLAIVRFFNFAPTFVDASWKEGWPRRVAASETTSRCRGPSRERSGKDGPRQRLVVLPAVIRRVFQSPAFTLTDNQPPIQSPYYVHANFFSNPGCSACHAERRTKKSAVDRAPLIICYARPEMRSDQ